MRRVVTILGLLVLVGVSVWAFRWLSVSPQARTGRPYAEKFALQIQQDVRFTNIQVRVWEVGSKGPLYVHGRVRSDSDAADLRRSFDALGCPVGVDWDVGVDTNLSGGVR